MKKNNSFTICSSSNLLDANRYWKKLEEDYKLEFAPFGDFITPLHENNNTGIIIILFCDDLIPNPNIEIDLLKKQYSSFIQMLENQASSSDNPVMIFWSKNENQNIISGVKRETTKQQFSDWFTEQLKDLKRRLKPIYLIDLNEIFYPSGSKEMFCERNWYFARCRLSLKGLDLLVNSLSKVIYKLFHSPSKVLVLDCDNTLWGGVVGEVGIRGIVLGQDGIGSAFVDFQREIINLYNDGVIIALASKNNEEEVWNVFNNHSEMILNKDHIVSSKINWKEKSLNVQEMAQELDLSLDSFVFWDDNPLERNKMRTILPQVHTFDVPQEVIYWPKILRANINFAKFYITEEDKNKSNQYKSREKFVNKIKNTDDIKSYLISLNLSPEIISINDSNIARAEQLCMKTNQFNIRTKRHLETDLQKFKMDNEDFIFLVRLKDEYGDHGIVSLICLKSIDDDSVFLDTFLMSCRILGRHLEAWILSEIIKRIKKNMARYLITEFIDTGRNSIALKFLNDYGFTEIKDSDKINNIKSKIQGITGIKFYLDTEKIDIPNLDIYEREKNELTKNTY
jgi:FkbH-like protein